MGKIKKSREFKLKRNDVLTLKKIAKQLPFDEWMYWICSEDSTIYSYTKYFKFKVIGIDGQEEIMIKGDEVDMFPFSADIIELIKQLYKIAEENKIASLRFIKEKSSTFNIMPISYMANKTEIQLIRKRKTETVKAKMFGWFKKPNEIKNGKIYWERNVYNKLGFISRYENSNGKWTEYIYKDMHNLKWALYNNGSLYMYERDKNYNLSRYKVLNN